MLQGLPLFVNLELLSCHVRKFSTMIRYLPLQGSGMEQLRIPVLNQVDQLLHLFLEYEPLRSIALLNEVPRQLHILPVLSQTSEPTIESEGEFTRPSANGRSLFHFD